MTTLLVTGGCRSGKSALAQSWAEAQSEERCFLATASAGDTEMAERIAAHQQARGQGWRTLESPLELLSALKNVHSGVVLVDCLTMWVTNMLLADYTDTQILHAADNLAQWLQQTALPTVLVSNETGWGIVPDNDLARRFRDLAGIVNQRLAQSCETVVLAVCGLPLVLKGQF